MYLNGFRMTLGELGVMVCQFWKQILINIYFEHHFHNMLDKNYNLSDVHDYLIKNGFKKVFKIKMTFRKTFEYIYNNSKYVS